MADGKKNDEIKVIKNPLLRQNVLLEEISGISFIVPATSEKPKQGEYGTKRDGEIPPLGEKKQAIEAKNQETPLFTDIPLDVSDSKETPEEPKLNISSPEPIKSENSTFFGLRSYIPSLPPILTPSSLKTTSNDSNIKEPSHENETLPLQRPVETVAPELHPPTTSAVSADISIQSLPKGPSLSPQNFQFSFKEPPPAVCPAPSNNIISEPGRSPPLTSFPPPIANVCHSGSVGNPYTLKNLHSNTSAHSNIPFINRGSIQHYQTLDSNTISFFTPSTEAAPSTNSLNLLSGPQIDSASVSEPQQPSAQYQSNQLHEHNFPSEYKKSDNSVLSSVQTFTSAISNFISPSKSPSDNTSYPVKPPENNRSDISSASNFYNNNVSSANYFSNPISGDNTLKESETDTSHTTSQPPLFQSQFPINQSNLILNQGVTSVPTFPFYSSVNNINNNFLDVSTKNYSPNTPLTVDNTICVSSITTALTSPAPTPSNSTINKCPVEGPTVTSVPTCEIKSNPISISDNIEVSSATSDNVCQYNQFHPSNNNLNDNNITDNQVIVSSQASSNNFHNYYNVQSGQQILPAPGSVPIPENNLNKAFQENNSLTNHSFPYNSHYDTPLNLNNASQHEELISPSVAASVNEISSLSANNRPVRPNLENTNRPVEQSVPVSNPPIERPVPVIQPIPTFNYFSSQASCFPPPLEPNSSANIPKPELPQDSFFKPIEGPNFLNSSSQAQPQPTVEKSIPVFVNPLPSAPPIVSFPPPNTTYPPKVTPPQSVKSQSQASPTKNTGPVGELDLEELDQIPLEGSAIPLYNPEYINRKKKVDVPELNNSFRLSKGLKKPTYAPVPDLGVTEKKNCPCPVPLANSPTNASVSSIEEMASIEAQNVHRISQTQSPIRSQSRSPGSSATLEPYYGNVVSNQRYRPPYHHWFFKSGRDKRSPWTPFSMADSLNLEQVFTSSELQDDTKVATDGGRYDVEIIRRRKMSVYWEEPPGEVRRCSWFVKSLSDSRYTPYDENIAALLEDEYKIGCETSEWNRRIELADGEVIILHSPSAMAHHVRSSSPDAWGSQPSLQQKPRVVKRGVEDFDIPKGEPKQVDHLLLVVHGVGKACDLRFRSLMEVVDDFRSISLQLVQSHFHCGVENGNVGRVEILPVEWHGALHTETINDRLSAITLPSIPRAREFTNETLLDILFYTSPVFCEKIVAAVGAELNRVYTLYKTRNPGFRGQVSLSGHSLGSLILFDILCHQRPIAKPHLSTQASLAEEEDETIEELGCLTQRAKAKLSRRMSYLTIGPGTGQPYTIYPQLLFQPKAFFALGSPIGMFVTVRGLESLGEDFKFPTCPAFFNIFHPNDPVAYRIEALIKPEMATVPAVLIPHHKGRKRMHLELKETMAHVTAALKQKLVDSMKNTWNTVYQLALFSRKDNALPGEVSKAIEDEVLRDGYLDSDPSIGIVGEEGAGSDVKVGKLNGGRRIDYVLQEAPLETFNQYISAIRSHLVYWESEDTVLMILKEIYGLMGINPDTQVSQAMLPFDVGGDNDTYSEYTYSIGATPTQFVRK